MKDKNVCSVYETTNYQKFKMLEHNREVKSSHFKRMVEAMRQEVLFTPIIVNEKWEIIEGQTRFRALVELERPVPYIIREGYGLKESRRISSVHRNWTSRQFAKSYADEGQLEYEIFEAFRKKYKFTFGCCMCLLSKSLERDYYAFIEGRFKVVSLEYAVKMAEKLSQIEKWYDGFRREGFVLALLEMLQNDDFIFGVFIQKLSAKANLLRHCVSIREYHSLIGTIYSS